MKYMSNPQNRLTIGGNIYSNPLNKFDVTRVENGFDSANVWLTDTKSLNYPTNFTSGKTVKIEVKDAPDTSYATIFNGKSLYGLPSFGNDGEFIQLKCVGNGYGLSRMFVAAEYGFDVQGLAYNTLGEILGDAVADNGIIHKWVNHLKGDLAVASGYAYATTGVSGVTGGINYVNFPYKPASKCIDDLCDQITAVKAGGAGPHWIVTTDDVIHCKLLDVSVGAPVVGWPQYYLGSAADATLVQGVDFTQHRFEKMGKEANYIVYAGDWRRPSTGDGWSENTANLWTKTGGGSDPANEGTIKKVGNYSLKFDEEAYYYPTGKNADWDFSLFGPSCIPHLRFYARRSGAVGTFAVDLLKDVTHLFDLNLTAKLVDQDKWYAFDIPIGNHWLNDETDYRWISTDGDWSQIDWIMFTNDGAPGTYIYIDGLHFSSRIIRIAAQAAGYSAADPCLMTLITDDVGKDDSLKASDDSGVMARLAYAKYLQCNNTPLVGEFTTPMLNALLPGQRLHVHAKPNSANAYQIDSDMRVVELVHNMTSAGYFTTSKVTDDLTNTHTRKRHDDLNKVYADMRPEFQDRQATNIKLGQLMYDVPTFTKTY